MFDSLIAHCKLTADRFSNSIVDNAHDYRRRKWAGRFMLLTWLLANVVVMALALYVIGLLCSYFHNLHGWTFLNLVQWLLVPIAILLTIVYMCRALKLIHKTLFVIIGGIGKSMKPYYDLKKGIKPEVSDDTGTGNRTGNQQVLRELRIERKTTNES
jgi:MFS family permease